MNQQQKKPGADQDLRSFLKSQHKRFYSLCRIFANNYKEHQRLFYDIISAVSHAIRHNHGQENKQTLMLRACVNMSALHSIALSMQPATDRSIQFKSPEYQNSMLRFRDNVGKVSDFDKIVLFLGFQKVSREEALDITGMALLRKEQATSEKKHFIPYIKEKLIWS
jgi:hypothetical protein